MQTDIFKLQIIALKNILPHERYDDSRALPLIERLKKDGFLANPIIVAKLDRQYYIQLDGMNRLTAFKKIGFSAILTQIVDYNDQDMVELSSWSHLTNLSIHAFLLKLGKIKDLSRQEGRIDLVGHRYIKNEGISRIATVVFRNGKVWLLYFNGKLVKKVEILNKIVTVYGKDIIRDILPSDPNQVNIDRIFDKYPDKKILIVLPTFTRHQIVDMVSLNKMFPAGVTRHIIKRRCLNLNLPLKLFQSGKSIKELNSLLDKFLKNRQVRLYEEPTIYFE